MIVDHLWFIAQRILGGWGPTRPANTVFAGPATGPDAAPAFRALTGTAGRATGGPITTTGTVTVAAATKANQQAASSNVLAVTPLHQQDHDSACKAWVECDGTGAILAGYNVTSVTHVSTGIFKVNFTTAFASANFACVATARQTAAANLFTELAHATAPTATDVTVVVLTAAAAVTDPDSLSVVCFGRQ